MCFETNFEEAAQRKTAKYLHLVEQAKARGRGYRSELITLQVGSRGVPDLPRFEIFAASLSLPTLSPCEAFGEYSLTSPGWVLRHLVLEKQITVIALCMQGRS